jgi:hypothetical protein
VAAILLAMLGAGAVDSIGATVASWSPLASSVSPDDQMAGPFAPPLLPPHARTSVEDSTDAVPGLRTFLEPNAPNPFRSVTRIGYSVSERTHVTLRVYDHLYIPVQTLVDVEQDRGRYVAFFNPGTLDRGIASGVYFVELRTTYEVQVRRMIFVR